MKTGITMVRKLAVFMVVTLAVLSVAATPTVQAMFDDAAAKEDAVRKALGESKATEAMLKAVRSVVNDYETLVRRYPNSGYSDDALWQAGRLSLDAFSRFRQPVDQETGARLLRMLQAEYPSSKFARLVPEQLREPAQASVQAERAQAPASKAPPRETAPSAPPPTPAPAALATIKAIRRVPMADGVRVVIEMDKEVPFHEERISGPSRIFVDFQSTRPIPTLADQTLKFESDSDVVRQVRLGRHPNVTRVVLDAAGVSSYSVYPLYSPYRLVIDCVRETAPQTSSVVAAAAVADRAKPVVLTPSPPAERPKPALVTSPAVIELPKATPVPVPTRTVSPGERSDLPTRRLVGQAGLKPSLVSPAGTALLRDAQTEDPLSGRRLPAISPRAVPSVAPLRSTEIAESLVTPRLASRALRRDWGRSLPSVAPAGSALLAHLAAPIAAPADSVPIPPVPSATASAAAAISPKPAPAAPVAKPGFSIARQLGLGVSRIVIDPGHGGHDPGAKGKSETEAELVLDVAQRLKRLLEAVPGVEVVLTRETDDFVPLQERTAIANRENADLFLSIHANASDSLLARGVETYFLNFANTLSAGQVAARENAASGQAMSALPDLVKSIALHNKLDESRDFATLVQAAMIERLRPLNKTIRNLGVKQAPFVVLIGASMPSVLAEISFITNPQEARLLKSDNYRDRIAEALFNGVRKYQASLARVQTVAHQ
jgi:N-acetylmuramoyl-L-alanine amidase